MKILKFENLIKYTILNPETLATFITYGASTIPNDSMPFSRIKYFVILIILQIEYSAISSIYIQNISSNFNFVILINADPNYPLVLIVRFCKRNKCSSSIYNNISMWYSSHKLLQTQHTFLNLANQFKDLSYIQAAQIHIMVQQRTKWLSRAISTTICDYNTNNCLYLWSIGSYEFKYIFHPCTILIWKYFLIL